MLVPNFSMTENSQAIQIEMGGTYLGESEIPNNVEVFKESLSILSNDLNVDLVYVTHSNDSSSQNLIIADFKKATWFFGFSRANMTAVIEYTLPNGEKVEIEGIYRAFGIGTKKQFLKNAFINANSKVLKELAK